VNDVQQSQTLLRATAHAEPYHSMLLWCELCKADAWNSVSTGLCAKYSSHSP